MSLQDVVPWSIIYGEQNKKHAEELHILVVIMVYEYFKDRMINGFTRGGNTLSEGIRYSITKGYITLDTMQDARDMYVQNFKNASEWELHEIERFISHLSSLM